MIRQCFLRCLLDSHSPIKLPHNVDVIVGRSKITKIKDQSCSRQQITLKADCEECSVELKSIGINPSGLDGFALERNSLYKLQHGSRVEILLNNYIHVIEFEPPPDNHNEQKQNKRKLEEDIVDSAPRKKSKTEAELIKVSTKEAGKDMWEEIDKGEVYMFTAKGVKSSSRIAAFDMDGTLIKTKSGKVHPVDVNDWQIAMPQVPQKLSDKFEEGYKIVILSNQSPIGSGRVRIDDFKKKIEGLVQKLNVPVQVYLATGKGIYRKPMTGMWKILSEKLLVLVGYPGSGKSFVAKLIEQKSGSRYVTVCRDVLGTWQKCASEASKLLQQGKSVIVDSTNPDTESRSRWTSIAKNLNVQCRCARMMTTKAHSLHNNKFREIMKFKHVPVNEIVFHSYKNKFVPPSLTEGFKEIIEVKFNPTFKDDEAEKTYRMYLLEK
ncbi:Bifunctional polynucleotide phosphatase/kinase [Danaus plexippus plexippus]|uniref:Bifunctional polynucleotide phosphatase/kinase n=1 Tax=Danaus plexippus plexippus TaxID=278856 RepID=A0A212F390_DANPL|nr:Bifunctional polynucleotide phosphatase/kinase [Danaus plexippus plexippus]